MQYNDTYLDHGDVGEELGHVVRALRRERRDGHQHLVDDDAQRPQVGGVVVAQVEDQLGGQVLCNNNRKAFSSRATLWRYENVLPGVPQSVYVLAYTFTSPWASVFVYGTFLENPKSMMRR
jgi:hypothetical protein